ncbi:hypothetical protein [Rhizobium sp. LC145]|uniref:hypothetical protein n=1 Tax=Rhizobium sp. LC145 TaxID=1120688 RepID=UPI000629F81A|nr:hypothetical protein [Rhizobium sp. LC145]KKX26177.1 hypothetical protein YH62_24085 [Rhizobium sp. LC145]TKT67116.1 hypothetical protein FDR95_03550 [Rhizobiaceae bacterium LC148]
MSEIEKIANTVVKLAKPKMQPKNLFEAVRKVHPKATKGEITRGAFYAVIMAAEKYPDTVHGLHSLAMESRKDTQDDNQ